MSRCAWWRTNQIVMCHLTGRLETSYRCHDGVDECAGRPARGRRWKSVTVKAYVLPFDHPTCRLALCSRFTLSYRDVEDLLAERGLDVGAKYVVLKQPPE